MQDRNEFQSLVKQNGSDTKEHTLIPLMRSTMLDKTYLW